MIKQEMADKRKRAFESDTRTGYVFHEATAAAQWPTLFDDNRFATNRARLESLFAQRSQIAAETGIRTSGLGSPNNLEIRKTVVEMKRHLKPMVRTIGAGNYMAAKNFLDSLANEARFVAIPARLEAVTTSR